MLLGNFWSCTTVEQREPVKLLAMASPLIGFLYFFALAFTMGPVVGSIEAAIAIAIGFAGLPVILVVMDCNIIDRVTIWFIRATIMVAFITIIFWVIGRII